MRAILPRDLRGPALVMLFSVYETAVTEIANLIREHRRIQIYLDDLRGGFLERALKYYRHVLGFILSMDNQHWARLTQLSSLR